ncbi:DUF4381 domain-containing protein [Thiohalocapsa marina]|uniref:DUF4381 domain-containing protein n=1 Tax=Thiohalocapsa marina TaxID=424902 RepID=A0A5M8FHY6_9GAMM|nr:DUF4381 domain-containing protein [Thiohalocapsa marina]KAA6184339.1 DUF4381 domain-containing protein [Thiohalocapsa marina]
MFSVEPQALRDIHAVMGNPWWPLAPGWWLLFAALLLLALVLWRVDGAWRVRFPLPVLTLGSWRQEAARVLRRLRREANHAAPKATASELSELLRRIAMARHGRAACAGLHGADWLRWLSAHDPRGFDWVAEGDLLLHAPYAPPADVAAERAALRRLIDAAMAWVGTADRAPTGSESSA